MHVKSASKEALVGIDGLTTQVFHCTKENMEDFGHEVGPEVPWDCDTMAGWKED